MQDKETVLEESSSPASDVFVRFVDAGGYSVGFDFSVHPACK